MKRLLAALLTLTLTLCCGFAYGEAAWSFTVSLTELQSEYSILVNRDHMLTAEDVPDDLVNLLCKTVSSTKIQMRETAAEAVESLVEDAKKVTEYTYKVQNSSGDWVEKTFSDDSGLRFTVKSGYRSYGTQKTVYANYLARNNGVDDGISSPPGSSEHQTGLCCDILSVDYAANNQYMNESFYQTPEAQWLEENCYSYGFIIRFPNGKGDLTGVPYEPWHIRYVGREIAGYIKNSELCYEEFCEKKDEVIQAFLEAGGVIEDQLLAEATQKAMGMHSTVLEVYSEDGEPEVSLSF